MNKTDELSALVTRIFIDEGPFTRDLGIGVASIDADAICLNFEMREGFIGIARDPMLHGGVVASALDVAGGIAAFASLISKTKSRSIEEESQRLRKLSTIDLHVDYLQPGRGKSFTVTAHTLRTGSKVAVVRMELHNEKEVLLAVGSGAYTYSFR